MICLHLRFVVLLLFVVFKVYLHFLNFDNILECNESHQLFYSTYDWIQSLPVLLILIQDLFHTFTHRYGTKVELKWLLVETIFTLRPLMLLWWFNLRGYLFLQGGELCLHNLVYLLD